MKRTPTLHPDTFPMALVGLVVGGAFGLAIGNVWAAAFVGAVFFAAVANMREDPFS